MHGLGNDFIVFEADDRRLGALPHQQWRELADRRRGIGFDQALVIEPPRSAGTEAYYRIFNADGSEVEQCGNGARCVAELLRLRHRTANGRVALESAGGLVAAELKSPGIVAVDMGEPDFSPEAVAFDTQGQPGPQYQLVIGDRHTGFSIVSMGNPHAVIDVDDVATAPVGTLGAALESHPRFRHRVNVGFRRIVSRGHIQLRVFERGVGETLACGTGACAAVATGRRAGLLDERVQVDLPGGCLTLSWAGPGRHLWMQGPAEVSFTGYINLQEFPDP
ncbi:MAG: diaminopimelate epimerase [Steroidobacteraceae bacterium]